MFQVIRWRRAAVDVRFCDGCAEVTTAAQRADRVRERDRDRALRWLTPR